MRVLVRTPNWLGDIVMALPVFAALRAHFAGDLLAAGVPRAFAPLLSAVPVPDPTVEDDREQILLVGDLPSPANPPSGCRFHTRCSYVQDRCKTEAPEWRKIDDEHFVACHFADELNL